MIPAVTYSLLMFMTGFVFHWILKKNTCYNDDHEKENT